MTLLKTVHVTDSKQAGVVNEPLKICVKVLIEKY